MFHRLCNYAITVYFRKIPSTWWKKSPTSIWINTCFGVGEIKRSCLITALLNRIHPAHSRPSVVFFCKMWCNWLVSSKKKQKTLTSQKDFYQEYIQKKCLIKSQPCEDVSVFNPIVCNITIVSLFYLRQCFTKCLHFHGQHFPPTYNIEIMWSFSRYDWISPCLNASLHSMCFYILEILK